MDSIGDFFKQVRETKGLTVEEVASKTRIRTDFVKALEEGNFAKLPDQVRSNIVTFVADPMTRRTRLEK